MIFRAEDRVYIDDERFYTIRKVKGRLIFVPCEELKKAQDYFLRAIKWEFPLKIDILKSALPHSNKKWVLKMDIKDFYSSVPEKEIQKAIKKVCTHIKNADSNYYFNLVTLDNKLPTGASTSAHLANACFLEVDKYIENYAGLVNVKYTRYMDDLTFSSDYKGALKFIEKRVETILNYYGYKLNKKKTKYLSDNKRQEILGLVVNYGKARINNNYKRKIRAMLYNYLTFYGDYSAPPEKYTNEQELRGHLSYIKHIDPKAFLGLEKLGLKLAHKYKIAYPF